MPGAILTTGPTVEPVTLAEAKLHLRIPASVTAEDTENTAKIKAARAVVERLANVVLLEQTWTLYLDRFPRGGCPGPYDDGWDILLPKWPVMSITSVTYEDTAAASQVLSDTTDFLLDASAKPARLRLRENQVWPPTRLQAKSVVIVFKAGFANAAAIPGDLREAVLKQIARDYWRRGDDAPVSSEVEEICACHYWTMVT